MGSAPVSQSALAAGLYRSPAQQSVFYGSNQIEAVAAEMDRLGRLKAFVVTSASVVKSPALQRLKDVLAGRFAGEAGSIGAHTPIDSVAAAADKAIDAGADMLVSLGGGSVIDATKSISFAVANRLRTVSDIGECLGKPVTDAQIERRPLHIAIPTTASAAEFTGLAGVLVPETRTKAALVHPRLAPDIVVHDPWVTLHTPIELWLSTAIRSLDHAVEALYGPGRNAYTDALAADAVGLLFAALPACRREPGDLGHRLAIQSATWLAGHAALGAGTSLSHGIGYLLGGLYGVPHGICSCVTLPAVMAWNLDASIEPLARIARSAGKAAATVDEAARLAPGAVRELIAGLGLPVRLDAVLQLSPAQRSDLGRRLLDLPHAASNPRKPKNVFELEALVGEL